jgi:hypothetical protein
MPRIILKKKAEVLAEFGWPESNQTCSIGSGSGNDVVVADKTVSFSHLQIERRGPRHFVRDLKSAYGTFVNGIKINALTEISDGDAISVGEHTLLFRDAPPAPHAMQDHADSRIGSRNEKTDTAPHSGPGHFQNDSVQEFDAGVPEASDIERLRPLRPEQEFELDNLEKELADVIEQAAPERNSGPEAATAAAQKSPYYLLAIHGPYLGKKFQLNFGETKIGRDARLKHHYSRKPSRRDRCQRFSAPCHDFASQQPLLSR